MNHQQPTIHSTIGNILEVITACCAAAVRLAKGTEAFAGSFEKVGLWAEEEATLFHQTAQVERKARIRQLESDLLVIEGKAEAA